MKNLERVFHLSLILKTQQMFLEKHFESFLRDPGNEFPD